MDLIVPYNNIENISTIKYSTNIPESYPTWNSGIIYGKSTDKSPILVQVNGQLYKSLINYNSANPTTDPNSWKYIADIQYPSASLWNAVTSYSQNSIVYAKGLYYKALSTNTGNSPSLTTASNAYWEFVGFTNSHSLLQNTAIGNTKLFSSGSIIRFDRLKEYRTISMFGLKNIESIDIIEKKANLALGPTSLGYTPANSNTINWQSIEYSDKLDLLVYAGNRISDNKLMIRYVTNLSKQTASMQTLATTGPFTTIEIDSQIYETANSFPTIPNKIYWSNLYNAFYIIGSTAAGKLNILRSENGISWTSCQLAYWSQTGNVAETQIASETTGRAFVDIIDAGNRLLAVTKYAIWSSTDGKNWVETYITSSSSNFHGIAFVPQTSSQTGFLSVVGDKGVAGAGFIWIFSSADSYQTLAREYSISLTHTLCTLYNPKTDMLLVGGASGVLRNIAEASKISKNDFVADAVTWTNTTFTVSGNSTRCVIAIKNSLQYGLVFLALPNTVDTNTLYLASTVSEDGSLSSGFTSVGSLGRGGITQIPIRYRALPILDRLGSFLLLLSNTSLILDDYDSVILNKYSYNIDLQSGQNILNITNTFNSTQNTKLYIYFNAKNNIDYAEVSNVFLGTLEQLGTTQANMSIGITDYSKKDTDEFGNTIFTERPYSQRINTNLIIRDTDIYKTYERIVSLRTTPCVWIGVSNSAEYNFLTVLGFYKEFSVDINYPEYALCSLSIESLANL